MKSLAKLSLANRSRVEWICARPSSPALLPKGEGRYISTNRKEMYRPTSEKGYTPRQKKYGGGSAHGLHHFLVRPCESDSRDAKKKNAAGYDANRISFVKSPREFPRQLSAISVVYFVGL